MRTTMWSKLLYVSSLIAGIVAIVQWYIKFPDMSQLIFGLHVALTLLMAAYLNTWMTDRIKANEEIKSTIEETNKAIDITRDYMREIEKKVDVLAKKG